MVADLRRLLLAGTLALAAAAYAQTDDAAQGGSRLQQRTSLTAVRLAVANATLDFVNRTPRATFDLSWDVLPPAPTFLTAASRQENARIYTFKIPNRALEGDWTKAVGKDGVVLLDALRLDRGLLAAGLGKDEKTREADYAKGSAEFDQEWGGEAAKSILGVADGGAANAPRLPRDRVTVSDYYAAIRDHNYLLTVLRSRGAACTVAFSGTEVRGEAIRKFRDEITWEIQVLAPSPEGSKDKSGAPPRYANFPYRVAIRARVRPFGVLFPNGVGKTVKIGADFGFSRSTRDGEPIDLFAGVDPRYTSSSFALDQTLEAPEPAQAVASENELAQSSLEADLSILTGAGLTDLVSKGLFGGTGEASIAGGGIVGAGSVKSFIGSNTDLKTFDGGSLGYLLGVVPGGDELFFGPSVRLGGLLLAPGLFATEASGDKTAFKFGVGLSYDLSQLLGTKQKNRITLDNATVGGTEWRADSDAATAGLGGVFARLARTDPVPGLLPPTLRGGAVYLRRADAPEGATPIVLTVPTADDKPVVGPKGEYGLLVPPGYDVRTEEPDGGLGGGVADTVSVTFRGRPYQAAANTLPLTEESLVSLRIVVTPSPTLLKPDDVLDARALYGFLASSDPLAAVLRGRLPTALQLSLASGVVPESVPAAFVAQAVPEINGILAATDLLTGEAGSDLLGADSPEAKALAVLNADPASRRNGAERIRLNRKALEAALVRAKLGGALKPVGP